MVYFLLLQHNPPSNKETARTIPVKGVPVSCILTVLAWAVSTFAGSLGLFSPIGLLMGGSPSPLDGLAGKVLSGELLAIMEFWSMCHTPKLYIPAPQRKLALLWVIIQSWTVKSPVLYIPPPHKAVFRAIVQLISIQICLLNIPPPLSVTVNFWFDSQ